MASVIETVDIDSDIRTVYNQWTQFETFKEFISGIDKITQVDDTHTHWEVTVGGMHRDFDTEITEQHPDERVAWKSTGGTTHAGVVTFHRLSETQTRLAAQIDWEPDSMVEKAGAALKVDSSQVKSALGDFKSFVENRAVETGSWRGEVDPPHANRSRAAPALAGELGVRFAQEPTPVITAVFADTCGNLIQIAQLTPTS